MPIACRRSPAPRVVLPRIVPGTSAGAKHRQKHRFDQLAHETAASAMGHLHRGVIAKRNRALQLEFIVHIFSPLSGHRPKVGRERVKVRAVLIYFSGIDNTPRRPLRQRPSVRPAANRVCNGCRRRGNRAVFCDLAAPRRQDTRRIPGGYIRDSKPSLGVKRRKRFAQGQSTFGNLADAPPFSRHNLEYFFHLPPGRNVALRPDRPGVLIFHLCIARFKLVLRTLTRPAKYPAVQSR